MTALERIKSGLLSIAKRFHLHVLGLHHLTILHAIFCLFLFMFADSQKQIHTDIKLAYRDTDVPHISEYCRDVSLQKLRRDCFMVAFAFISIFFIYLICWSNYRALRKAAAAMFEPNIARAFNRWLIVDAIAFNIFCLYMLFSLVFRMTLFMKSKWILAEDDREADGDAFRCVAKMVYLVEMYNVSRILIIYPSALHFVISSILSYLVERNRSHSIAYKIFMGIPRALSILLSFYFVFSLLVYSIHGYIHSRHFSKVQHLRYWSGIPHSAPDIDHKKYGCMKLRRIYPNADSLPLLESDYLGEVFFRNVFWKDTLTHAQTRNLFKLPFWYHSVVTNPSCGAPLNISYEYVRNYPLYFTKIGHIQLGSHPYETPDDEHYHEIPTFIPNGDVGPKGYSIKGLLGKVFDTPTRRTLHIEMCHLIAHVVLSFSFYVQLRYLKVLPFSLLCGCNRDDEESDEDDDDDDLVE